MTTCLLRPFGRFPTTMVLRRFPLLSCSTFLRMALFLVATTAITVKAILLLAMPTAAIRAVPPSPATTAAGCTIAVSIPTDEDVLVRNSRRYGR